MKRNSKTSDKRNAAGDIHDSRKDAEKMKPEESTINLPDAEDIPGQEHVRPPKMMEFADTTISSDDEEGRAVFNDQVIDDTTVNVSNEERELLEQSVNSMASEDDLNWE